MKFYTSSVSPKGQVTIPQEIRDELGIKPKDKVLFQMEDGEVKIVPMASALEPFYRIAPPLKKPLTWEEIEEIIHEEIALNAVREGSDDAK